MKPVLSARGLSVRLGGQRRVDQLDLDVGAGTVVGLLGPNGAGKTTTFKLITGLLRADEGDVRLDGEPLHGPLSARVRRGLGYLPQRRTVLRGLTARQHLLLPLQARGASGDLADSLLADAGLTELADRPADRLSGGERRRLELARCLATAPRALLLDEPFAGVDPVAVEGLTARIAALAASGLAILLTDHAVRAALASCDSVVLLDRGRCVVRGTPAAIAADPVARERWLGAEFEVG